MANEKKEKKVVVIEGVITKAVFGRTKFDDTKKNRVSILVDDDNLAKLRELGADAYKDSGKKLTPKWMTEKGDEGTFINFSSVYDIPTRGDCNNFDEINVGAEVKMAVNFKEGASYPQAIHVIANGDEFDAFRVFDEED